jgi:hypothetical protein
MSNIFVSEITDRGGSLPKRFPELRSMVLPYLGTWFDVEHELAPLCYSLSP